MANSNIPVKIEFGAVDNITQVLGTINLRLGNITKSCAVMDKTFKKLSFSSIMMMSTQLNQELQKFSTKFSGILSGSIDDASNMEDNLTRVSILLGKKPSDNFFGTIKKQWKELAEVSTMSASEISDVSKDIVNSGIKKDEEVIELTTRSVLLADASKRELSASEAFSLLNEFKNSFGLNIKDIPALADKIVYARDHGMANFSDIKEGFKYAAPTWGALTNSKPEDYLAFVSELSNHGITGSTAGTSLRRLPLLFTKNLDKNTLLHLKNSGDEDLKKTLEDFSSNKHNTVLNALGINFDSIKTEDKTSNKIDLFKALKVVEQNLPKLKIEDQNAVIQQLFGQEALSTGITAIRFMEKITAIVNEVKNHSQGKALQLANSTRNTLRSEIIQTKHAWDNFKISVLDSSTGDGLKYINKLMKSLAQNLQTMPSPMKNFIGYTGLAAYGITELSSALAPVMMTLYFMASTFKIIAGMSLFSTLLSEIGLVINCFRSLTVITAVWNTLCAVNPYVLLFMAISSAILLVINNLDWLKDKFKIVADYIEAKLSVFKAWMHAGNFPNSIENNNTNLERNYNNTQASSYPLFTKQNQNSSVDINVKFDSMPQGTKVVQKTKNIPPANLKLGFLGGSLQ